MTLPELEALLAGDDNTEDVDAALRSHADALIACARALQNSLCPVSWSGDDGTAEQCIARGHCGCDIGTAIKALEDVK